MTTRELSVKRSVALRNQMTAVEAMGKAQPGSKKYAAAKAAAWSASRHAAAAKAAMTKALKAKAAKKGGR